MQDLDDLKPEDWQDDKISSQNAESDQSGPLDGWHFVECIQTVFGEEQARRLKQAFDVILGFDTQKRKLTQDELATDDPKKDSDWLK